jgi:hypothetical protein
VAAVGWVPTHHCPTQPQKTRPVPRHTTPRPEQWQSPRAVT